MPHSRGASEPHEALSFDPSRREILAGGTAALAALLFHRRSAAAFADPRSLLGFASIAPATVDAVRLAEGYTAELLWAWGDPIRGAEAGPAWKEDASNSAEEQLQQAGMHHDGMAIFPLDERGERALLAINHEYIDNGLLFPEGLEGWSSSKVRKSQAAVGVSIVELALAAGRWRIVDSRYARRVSALTPCRVSGPAAARIGAEAIGTLANCAHGQTPWGTYLTCEENFREFFHRGAGVAATSSEVRYEIANADGSGKPSVYAWEPHDARFDLAQAPQEAERFGWVVEIDPFDPESAPVKRSGLGRFAHENAAVVLSRDGRVVVYLADDARGEHLYKFVSTKCYDPADRASARELLDDGVLYVARFDAGDTGVWLPLVHGTGPLVAKASVREGERCDPAVHGFRDQADVLIHARLAATAVGATPLDRPEWVAIHPEDGECFASLTNNNKRGTAAFPIDDANPRVANNYGHVLRWRESLGDPAAETFRWSLFQLCGDRTHADPARRGNLKGPAAEHGFACPDGLAFDARGVLWIQTDMSADAMRTPDFARFGTNQILAVDPRTGETRRFLTGPRNAEITGLCFAPDGQTLFVNVQHPGENLKEQPNDPRRPDAFSSWPSGVPGARPRSATLAIRRRDGGVIGAP
ncbi:MAG: PhoX family phosphatase [Planctomycetes bacterium]|nr:PhoX family phosphatase [Planctomycetota bacterium]